MMGTMPVSLFESMPEYCPYDHLLGPGRVVRGWQPCGCGPALRPGASRGHLWIKCRTCEEHGHRTLYYEPPHDGAEARHADALTWDAGAGQWLSVPA
jgi:hypothetical protein